MPQSGSLVTDVSALSNELENSFYVLRILPNFFSPLRLGVLGVLMLFC